MPTHLVRAAGIIGKAPGDGAGDILYAGPDDKGEIRLTKRQFSNKGDLAFGKPTRPDNSNFEIFPSTEPTLAENCTNFINESVYLSRKKQPTGTSFKRGFSLPSNDVSFGLKSPDEGYILADLINPTNGVLDETPENKKRYLKTHRNFDPGQQDTRDYKWPACVMDNRNFQFGSPDPKNPDGIYQAFTWDPSVYEKSRLTNRYVRFSARNCDSLGRSRSTQGKLPVDANFRFGRRQLSAPRDTALNLIRGR